MNAIEMVSNEQMVPVIISSCLRLDRASAYREEECDNEESKRLVREVVKPPREDFLWLVEILEELGHRVTVLGLEVSGLDVEE